MGEQEIASIQEKFATGGALANFMMTLAENSRLPRTAGVIAAFEKIMKAHRGEVPCTVTSASALDANTMATLKKSLDKFLKPSETLQVVERIDPSLIGGVVVNIGEYFIDMSIATKVKKISEAIKIAV